MALFWVETLKNKVFDPYQEGLSLAITRITKSSTIYCVGLTLVLDGAVYLSDSFKLTIYHCTLIEE